MKVSYEERLAIDFGLRRRCDEGNDVVLSVRAGGNPGQLFCSEILTSVDRSCDNNRLLNDGTHTYTYDFEGNRTKKTVTATGEATEYQWDHRNRLVQVKHLDSAGDPVQTLDYIYDVLDRRIGKTDTPAVGPGYTERYVYDGEHLALKFGSSALANRYLHGPVIDHILADEQVSSLSSAGDVLWPLADHLGTVRDLAEYDSGTGDTVIVNHISYDAYGGSRTETNAAVDHLFGYTGREWDAEADLQYNRARWYDPAVGRWLSEDPIGFAAGDANLSRYVENSPTEYVDPMGESPFSKAMIIAAKKAANSNLRKIVKDQIEQRLERLAMQKGMKAQAKQLTKEAADILDHFDRATSFDWRSGYSWLSEVAEFVPIAGDAFGTVKFGKTLNDARTEFKALENRIDAAEKAAKKAAKWTPPPVSKAVNTDIVHPAERAVERGVLPDPKRADSVLVPFGNGHAVYEMTKNGTAILRTVLGGGS